VIRISTAACPHRLFPSFKSRAAHFESLMSAIHAATCMDEIPECARGQIPIWIDIYRAFSLGAPYKTRD